MAQVSWRSRDVGVAVLALAALLASWNPTFRLTASLAWVLDTRLSSAENFGQTVAKLPPFVADLDGDGAQELIMLNSELLSIHELPDEHTPGHRLGEKDPGMYRLAMSDLETDARSLRLGKKPRTVSYSVGFLNPYDRQKPRKQFIAALRDDWTVTLWDSGARTVWRASVMDVVAESLQQKQWESLSITESKVILTPRCSSAVGDQKATSVREALKHPTAKKEAGDVDCGGTVIVAARLSRVSSKKNRFGIEADGPAKWGAHDESVNHEMDHLGVVALDGLNGELRWAHVNLGGKVSGTSPAYVGNATDQPRVFPSWQYKHVIPLEPMERELHWTRFRKSALRFLFPHSFTDPTYDTTVGFMKVEMGSRGKGSARKDKEREKSTVSRGLSLAALAPGKAKYQHREEEHTKEYNGVFVRHSMGIEILSVQDGTHVSSINMRTHSAHSGAYYADINGDSVVDSVLLPTHPDIRPPRASETLDEAGGLIQGHTHHRREGEEAQREECLTVLSGLPPRQQLFHSHVPCREDITDVLDSSTASARKRWNRYTRSRAAIARLHFAPPLFIKRTSAAASKASAASYDIVVASNDGIVTSLAPDGRVNWQSADGVLFDHGRERRPPLTGYGRTIPPDDSYLEGERMLFVGSSEWVMMGQAGEVLARGTLLQAIVAEPRIVDINNDGVIDIVFLGSEVVWGLALTMGSRIGLGIGIPVLILLLVAAFVFIVHIREARADERLSGRPARPLFYVKRSTD